MGRVLAAQNAGFCFGVRRAIDELERLLSAGGTVYTLGEVIHNPQIVSSLRTRGAVPLSAPEELPLGATVMIRAHGVSRDVIDRLKARTPHVIDETCPFVKRIHAIAEEAGEKGIPIYVIGDKAHPEVQGILGWSRGMGRPLPCEEDLPAPGEVARAIAVSQTTAEVGQVEHLLERLSERAPPPKSASARRWTSRAAWMSCWWWAAGTAPIPGSCKGCAKRYVPVLFLSKPRGSWKAFRFFRGIG